MRLCVSLYFLHSAYLFKVGWPLNEKPHILLKLGFEMIFKKLMFVVEMRWDDSWTDNCQQMLINNSVHTLTRYWKYQIRNYSIPILIKCHTRNATQHYQLSPLQLSFNSNNQYLQRLKCAASTQVFIDTMQFVHTCVPFQLAFLVLSLKYVWFMISAVFFFLFPTTTTRLMIINVMKRY